jgi:hypothetical protein
MSQGCWDGVPTKGKDITQNVSSALERPQASLTEWSPSVVGWNPIENHTADRPPVVLSLWLAFTQQL